MKWKEIFHANGHQKRAGVALLLSDKTNFKATAAKKDKDRHYIMINRLVQQENIIKRTIGGRDRYRKSHTTLLTQPGSRVQQTLRQ